MNPAVFIRASVRRNVASSSFRAFASKAPPSAASKARKTAAASSSGSQPAAEAAEAQEQPEAPLSSLPSLDFAPGEEPHRERTGAKSSKDSLSSIERRRRLIGQVTAGLCALGLAAAAWHSGREWEDDELKEMRMVRNTSVRRLRSSHGSITFRNARRHLTLVGEGCRSAHSVYLGYVLFGCRLRVSNCNDFS